MGMARDARMFTIGGLKAKRLAGAVGQIRVDENRLGRFLDPA